MNDSLSSSLIAHCAAAVFVIDAEHRVLLWNSACEKLTGVNAAEVTGTNSHWRAFYDHCRPCLSDLIIDRKLDRFSEHYADYAPSTLLEDGWHAEGWYQNLGGRKRYISFDAAPIYDHEGNLIAAIETLHDITERKKIEEKNISLATALQEALNRIKILSGCLPICASCKKIRDEKGSWIQIESYIRDHSEAEFSHGICPECAKKLYPEFDLSA